MIVFSYSYPLILRVSFFSIIDWLFLLNCASLVFGVL